MTDYQLDWQAGTITWTIGGKERVRITRKNADSDFPTGPLGKLACARRGRRVLDTFTTQLCVSVFGRTDGLVRWTGTPIPRFGL